MKRFLSTALAVTLLLSLGALAALARGGGDILTPAGGAVAAQPQTAAAPDAPMAGKYNMLGMPLSVSSITDAETLEAYIESNTSTTVDKLLKWDASLSGTGGYYIWDPDDPEGSTSFDVNVGDAFWLLSIGTGSPVLSYVGDVPAEHSVTFVLVGNASPCLYNMITVPLDKGSITRAELLANDIGVSNVSKLLSWDPALSGGSYLMYDPADPEGSTDFGVKIGYPYWVCMKAGTNWPQWP